MSMSKKDFIELADRISRTNKYGEPADKFNLSHLETIAEFCKWSNPAFKTERWLDYIAGKCGPNGGAR